MSPLYAYTPPPEVLLFERELKDIAEAFKHHNHLLFDTARKSKEAKGSKNFIGAFLSLYLQEYELRIVEAVMNWIMNETDVMGKGEIRVGTYEYDGIKLYTEYVEKYGKSKLLKEINEITPQLTGFHVEWEEKVIKDYFDVTEFINSDDDELNENPEIKALLARTFDADSDTGIVETIMKISPNHFIFQIDDKSWYCWNGSNWANNDVALRKTITYDVPKFWEAEIAIYANYNMEYDENLDVKMINDIRKHVSSIIHKCRDYTYEQ